jgi:hypothetical protein
MDDVTAAQVQDQNRTARAFISFLSTALGNDQSLPGTDAYAVNPPRAYQTLGPGGLVGVEGTSRSNAQSGATLAAIPPIGWLALAAVAYFAWGR